MFLITGSTVSSTNPAAFWKIFLSLFGPNNKSDVAVRENFPIFLAFSSARSYTVAGSYLRFLLDEYGADKLRKLYQSGGDFDAVYGMRQSALSEQWRAIIHATVLP